jgi:hypothetical protein
MIRCNIEGVSGIVNRLNPVSRNLRLDRGYSCPDLLVLIDGLNAGDCGVLLVMISTDSTQTSVNKNFGIRKTKQECKNLSRIIII